VELSFLVTDYIPCLLILFTLAFFLVAEILCTWVASLLFFYSLKPYGCS
jgi:hypothetical protein